MIELSTHDTTWFLVLTGLIVGLTLGSFTTMLTYRLPRRQSIVSPPSSCPHCNMRLKVRDLVPVFSWLFAGGKCRYCHTPIGARYLLIELAVALSVMAAFWGLGFSLLLIPALLTILFVIAYLTILIEKK